MKKSLIAERSLKYGGRRLEPGDGFEAKRGDAKVLVGIGKARYAPPERKPEVLPVREPEQPAPAKAPPEPMPSRPAPGTGEKEDPASPALTEETDLRKLTNAELRKIARQRGIALEGKETKAQLVERITESLAGRYRRRDMRAED